MSYIYTEKMLFLQREEGEAEGWTTDCNEKKDYDPVVVRISSRVYPDGTYTQSVYVGGDTKIFYSGVRHAATVSQARAIIEQEAEKHADRIISAVKTAYAGTTGEADAAE